MKQQMVIKQYTLAGALALGLVATAVAAPEPAYLPPPGLYQIDVVSDRVSHSPGGKTTTRETVDGATGAQKSQFRRSEGKTGSHATAGAGPNRICLGPTAPGALPKNLKVDGCNASKGQVIGGQMVATHSCPWGNIKLSMRKVDAKTWETTTEMTETSLPSGNNRVHPLRDVYEEMARSKDPKVRAEGKEMLAEAKKAEEELKDAPLDDLPMEGAAMRGAPLEQQKSVMRMTRLGDCKA